MEPTVYSISRNFDDDEFESVSVASNDSSVVASDIVASQVRRYERERNFQCHQSSPDSANQINFSINVINAGE